MTDLRLVEPLSAFTFYLTSFLAPSLREYPPQDGEGRLRIDCSHLRKESLHWHGADLIEGYRCRFALQANRITGRKIPDGRGNRDKNRRKVKGEREKC